MSRTFTPTSTSTKRNLPPSTELRGPVRVLGIDPGTLVTGYGVVERRDATLLSVTSGEIVNAAGTPLAERLLAIHTRIRSLADEYRPVEMAIESAFYGKNAQSALKLGHARGVCLLAAAQSEIPAVEYSPREVKKAVAGNGNASKDSVRYMVCSLLGIPAQGLRLDVSDALAVALCHLQRFQVPSHRYRDWKSFVEAHPERVRR
jgi:crossover junction endodeoxyribonuclease RuvC